MMVSGFSSSAAPTRLDRMDVYDWWKMIFKKCDWRKLKKPAVARGTWCRKERNTAGEHSGAQKSRHNGGVRHLSLYIFRT